MFSLVVSPAMRIRALTKLTTGSKINPNTATKDQLMLLPGVGEVTAKRIIDARPFQKPEDLAKVEGIGRSTLKRLTPFLQLPWPALLVAAMLIPFFHAKARREERWLREKFPEYAEYERRVRRFIPWIY